VRSDLQEMVGTVLPKGPFVESRGNKEHLASAKEEYKQIETILVEIKKLLGL
jgi:hypothetical protein